MKREQKFHDTATFHFYNANPKNKLAGDCVVRAICTALGQSWEMTVRELTEIGIKYGYVLNEKKCYERYLKQKGWMKCKQPRHLDNTKFTGDEFCRQIAEPNEKFIAHIGGHHVVAIIDQQVYDTWNSTSRTIGNYWYKEEQ